MHDRQQHVGIDSEISVMRNLHKFRRDSFLGRRGWFNNVCFCFLLTLFKFSTFFIINYCWQLLVILQEIEIQTNNTLLFVL